MTRLSIDISVHIEKPAADVFSAWSSADALASWFSPNAAVPPDVSMDFSVGGQYEIVTRFADGGMCTTRGEFQEIVTAERIVMTWHCDAFPDPVSRVIVSFSSTETGTVVRVLHEGFESEQTCANHYGGWEGCLEKLSSVLMAA